MSAKAPLATSPAAALATKIVLAPILLVQGVRTRRRAQRLAEAAGPRDGRSDGVGAVLRLLVAGDSSAAGVGVATQDEAVVGYLVRSLRRQCGRPVAWSLRARSGLTTRALHDLLRSEPPPPADFAVIITGVNDVTGAVGVRRALAHRAALADWLLAAGLARHVVFAPLPPLHRFPLLPEPLRRVLGSDARRHDLTLARWAAGRDDVSHAGFEIDLSPSAMASDGFHPGGPVYRACGEALAAHVVQRLATAAGPLSADQDDAGTMPGRPPGR